MQIAVCRGTNDSLLPREKVSASANLRSKVAIERSEIYGFRGKSLLRNPSSVASRQLLAAARSHRGSDNTLCCHSLPLPFESSSICIPAKRKSPRKNVDFIFLAGAGGLEPATHGFGVALNVSKALKLLTFSHVSMHFSH